MGMYHSAYFAYGIRIADTDPDVLDRNLPGSSEVGHLQAGGYDRDMTFLVTKCTEADLGDVETVTPQTVTAEQYEAWNADLKAAATALGITEMPDPGWLLIPDMS